MLENCIPHHDWFNALLTFGLCCGLVISYLPQHFRIIHAKSSEGISPVFLLLGTTSAASAFFNMITLQAPIVRCCRVVGFGSCVEMTAGVIQIGLQWFCFSLIFVLYMIYYPEHLKYVQIDVEDREHHPLLHVKTHVRSEEWRLSIILAWITAAHFLIVAITTAYLLGTTPDSPIGIPPPISAWATLLGVSAAILATIQYAPQLIHTYRMKLVGALSIPMMMIQTPGGILMVTSIVLRPGTNWTSWITFALAAILQGCLLAMCIAWKFRQRRLHIDDFGNPLESTPGWSHPDAEHEGITGVYPSENDIVIQRDIIVDGEERHLSPRPEVAADADEQTPLLDRRNALGSPSKSDEAKGWQAWFKR